MMYHDFSLIFIQIQCVEWMGTHLVFQVALSKFIIPIQIQEQYRALQEKDQINSP